MSMRRIAIKVVLAVLAVATLQPAVAAFPDLTAGHTLTAFKQTSVSFKIRNERKEKIELRMGEEVMTVPALSTVKVKVPEGTRIVFNQTVGTDVAGGLVYTATRGDSNVNTVVIH
jgi:hypothetical protein